MTVGNKRLTNSEEEMDEHQKWHRQRGLRTTMMQSSTSTVRESVRFRVLSASTGVCYPIKLDTSELTVINLRRHLAGFVQADDQILLLGPPYKVPKDSTLRSEDILSSLRLGDEEDGYISFDDGKKTFNEEQRTVTTCSLGKTEKTGARRLFLFSKKELLQTNDEEHGKEGSVTPCVLEPRSLNIPSQPDPSPLVSIISGFSPMSSTLHQALEVYERKFMLNLCRGRVFADGSDLRISSCRKCISEQCVIVRALRAAVSNLSDHRNNATRVMQDFASDFHERTGRHSKMLNGFESTMQSLSTISLHQSLISVAQRSGRRIQTLLDTVPVERENAWAAQCQTAHSNLLNRFSDLEISFSQVGNISVWDDEARGDLDAEEKIIVMSNEVETEANKISQQQAQRLDQLTIDHARVVQVVMGAISREDSGANMMVASMSGVVDSSSDSSVHVPDKQNAQTAFSVLEELSQASKGIIPSMELDDNILTALMQRVADDKTNIMRRMRFRLRQISVAQSTIQRVLSSHSVLRDALAQQSDNMMHLEHIPEFTSSYRHFLSEVRRRRAYGVAVTSLAAEMIERMASMRVDEVKERERFLRGPGQHLMPAFFDIFAPTLASPPPLFAPHVPAMAELDTLPDVGTDIDFAEEQVVSAGETSGNNSISDERNRDQIESVKSRINSVSMDAGDKGECAASGDDQDQQGLIVSADETSSNELMETYHEQRVAAEAERNTLAYENTVLRQAIERLGGKPPRTYVQQSRVKDKINQAEHAKAVDKNKRVTQINSSLESRILSLENELAIERKKVDHSMVLMKRTTDEQLSETCDKISHSGFEVGDVGLFMPTGRGSGGKRTYLAFHSNCPHRYLCTESVDGTPDYVLGRIIYQAEKSAGPLGSKENPFGLHIGTKFWVLTVEVIKIP